MLRPAAVGIVLLAGAASATVIESPPVDPACRSLIGVWQRDEPKEDRRGRYWQSLYVGDIDQAYFVEHSVPHDNRDGPVTFVYNYTLTCERPGEGRLIVNMTPYDSDRDMASPAQMTIEKLYTNGFVVMEPEEGPYPPPPNWAPRTVPAKWRRTAP